MSKKTEAQKTPVDLTTDVACLDHYFFIEEIQRIEQRCNSMQKQLGSRNYGSSLGFRKNSSTYDQRKAQLLNEISYDLDSYKELFMQYKHFEAVDALKKLYDIQELLDKLNNSTDTSWYEEYCNKLEAREDQYYEEWTCSEEEYFQDCESYDLKPFSGKKGKKNNKTSDNNTHVKSPQKTLPQTPQKTKTIKTPNNAP